jgi:hypothetical protein
MFKILFVFIFILFFAMPIFAQSVDTAWVRRYDGTTGVNADRAYAIAVDRFGNVVVIGESFNGTDYDYATIKYYSNGDTAWVRRYNGPANSDDYAKDISVDVLGNVYVTGNSYGVGTDMDYATIKYYPNGDTAWVRRYNGSGNGWDIASAIAVDSSGNIYVTGGGYEDLTVTDYVTLKYSPNGDTAWVRRYNGPGNGWDEANAIAVDGSGNIYVTGTSYGGEELWGDYATIKYYPNGDTAWVRRYGSYRDEEAYDIAVDNSGNIYVTGVKSLSMRTTVYASIKYDLNGNELWVRIYFVSPEYEEYNIAYAIAADNSGNAYVTGMSTSSGGGATIKYYPNGDTAWVRRYSNGVATDIAVDTSGNVYVTGSSYSGGTSYDFATIKYYPNGDTAWVRRYNGPGSLSDHANTIIIDGSGNVYVTGESYGSGTDADYVTIKYVQFLRGDASNDDKVTVSDVVYLINYLFKGGPTPNPLQSGDANCDGQVTVSDVVYLINYLFKGGPPPAC